MHIKIRSMTFFTALDTKVLALKIICYLIHALIFSFMKIIFSVNLAYKILATILST